MLDIEERVNDVIDALGGYIAGPRSVRRIAPIVPNADQIRRITLEKSTRIPRPPPLGQITLARYPRRRRACPTSAPARWCGAAAVAHKPPHRSWTPPAPD